MVFDFVEFIKSIKFRYSMDSMECKDISNRCNRHKRYCGNHKFVTKRCQKMCGFCGK